MRSIDPRTSRLLRERSTIWATSPWLQTAEEAFVSVGKQEVKIPLGRCFLYKTSIKVVFWRKLINCSMSLTSEMRGIAPRTSGLLSRRSTIRHISHVYQISRNFFFRLVSNYEAFLFVRRKSTCYEFQYAIDYLEIVITIWWEAVVLDNPGIDPRTSRMQSERSTIWATSPEFRTVEEAFVSVGKQEVINFA